MRVLVIPLLLVLSSCGQGDEAANQGATATTAAVAITGHWGANRDRMCLQNDRAGLIVYAAEGDSNCMVQGSVQGVEGGFRLKPDGDESCAIDAKVANGAVTLGEPSPACAYYCGPKASFANKRLEPMDLKTPVQDLAGDPLC